MKRFISFAFGSAFLISGALITNGQAFTSQAEMAMDTDRIVTFDHRPAHNDCQKDEKGSHFHKGMKDNRVNCPGGKK